MQEASEKARPTTQSSGKFMDTLISQWIKRTGNSISVHQSDEQAACSSGTQGNKVEVKQQILQNQDRLIQDLRRKLRESQLAEASLSASLEIEARNKEEIQTKLNATWKSIDTIEEYFNYITESLTSFQQHRINLSDLFNNVILKQQEAIQKLQWNKTKSKDLENHIALLENKSLLQEERLQSTIVEQNKLQKQLENSERELQLQKNELASSHAEKLMLVKEQQRLLSEYENLQSRLQTIEKEKCDITKLVAQLENKLLVQEEKLQEALMEQNKLRKQLENSEYELQLQKNELANSHSEEKLMLVKEQQRLLSEYENLQSQLQTVERKKDDIAKSAAQLESKLLLQEKKTQEALMEQDKLRIQMENAKMEKNELMNTHIEEKKILVEEQQQMLSQFKSLHSQLNTMEQEKSNTAETVAQKDALLSKLQDDIFTYKKQIEVMMTRNNEACTKCQTLTEKQNMWEKELRAKAEKIQNLEMTINAFKPREVNFINDINRMEKKLISDMDCIKNLEIKLANAHAELQNAQRQNAETQKTLERTKASHELGNMEHQQQLKVLKKEKEEALNRESSRIKNAGLIHENIQAKHTEEVSALKGNHEAQLSELKRTIDRLTRMTNEMKNENSMLSVSILEVRTENNNLKKNCEQIMKRNEDLQGKLKEAKEAKETLQVKPLEDRKSKLPKDQKNVKRKEIQFHPKVTEIPESDPYETQEADLNPPVEKKFFRSSSRPALRTYKRR